MVFHSLEELKQFVINQQIENYEKQRNAEKALLDSLKGNK